MKDQNMEFATRLAARKAGGKTYFTGVVCENGHIDKRYASNGGCLGCMLRRQSGETAALRKARAHLLRLQVRCRDVDLEFVKSVALAFSIARCPWLVMGDVYKQPKRRNTGGLHTFNVHPDDRTTFHQIVKGL